MNFSDDEDENLVHFLELELLSEISEQEEENVEERKTKRKRVQEAERRKEETKQNFISLSELKNCSVKNRVVPMRNECGFFSKLPPELVHHIFKRLSSEDLLSCSLVCRFLVCAASDESLWQRLYRMRWDFLIPRRKIWEYTWKKLYIERDGMEMYKLVSNYSNEFKEYYIQMIAAKRSQTPFPSQLGDDGLIIDKTLADQVSSWISSRGLNDTYIFGQWSPP